MTEKRRTVRVTMPARCLVHLHSRKVLEGVDISDTVTEALRRYFDARAA